jgi:hypothetical protein
VNVWESIFAQSRVNKGYYAEDCLPQLKWDWPKGTWFQSRLDYIRHHHLPSSVQWNRKMSEGDDLRTM